MHRETHCHVMLDQISDTVTRRVLVTDLTRVESAKATKVRVFNGFGKCGSEI